MSYIVNASCLWNLADFLNYRAHSHTIEKNFDAKLVFVQCSYVIGLNNYIFPSYSEVTVEMRIVPIEGVSLNRSRATTHEVDHQTVRKRTKQNV